MTLPEGWVETTIESLAAHEQRSITDGPFGSALKSDHYTDLGIRVIRLNNIGPGNFIDDDAAFISLERFQELQAHEAKEGDFVTAALGEPLGRTCIIPNKVGTAIVKADCFRTRAHSDIDKNYILAVINSPNVRKYFAERGRGIGRVRINLQVYRSTIVPVAPVAEQRRIVAKLDALTGYLVRARAELDRVGGFVQRLRIVALARLWSSTKRQTLTGLLAEPIRNGLSVAGSDQPPGQPALRLSALRGATVNLSDVRYIPIAPDRADKYRIEAGDILVSRGNGTLSLVGKASRVGEASGEYPIFPDTAFRLRPDPSFVCSEWLLYVWNSPDVRRQIESVARTTAGIWKISQRDLAQIQIPVASLEDQRRMAAAISIAFARADRLETEAARARVLLDRLEAAILARAFRGQLVPQDPNDEPASVLLDRIRAERAAAPKPKRGRARKAVG